MKFFLHLLIFTLPLLATAQTEPTLESAKALAHAKKFKQAEVEYNKLLAANPKNLDALIGAAYNHAWSGNLPKAIEEFKKALRREPENAIALTGLGYSLAWSGEFVQAKVPFKEIQKRDPENVEATKGLAYVYLWQGNGQVAEMFFQQLADRFPQEAEYQVGLGQAALLMNKNKLARQRFEHALSLEPGRKDAIDFLHHLKSRPSKYELDIWAGQTQVEDESSFGLRAAQLNYQTSNSTRLWLRYDNALSQDNLLLLRQNRAARGFFIGGFHAWKNNHVSRLELGLRELPDGTNQRMILGEQAIHLPKNLTGKIGGLLGATPKLKDDWMLYGSLQVPISKFFIVEPGYFYAQMFDEQIPENRFTLATKFRSPGGYELVLNGMWGKVDTEGLPDNGKIMGGGAFALLPVSRIVWLMANFRYENGVFEDLKTFALGVRVRMN